ISKAGAFVSSIAFGFSGFFVSWLEWGNIVSTGLWLPLILLSIDRICQKTKDQIPKTRYVWGIVFLFSLVSSFFAGHLQTFFYMSIISAAYIIFRSVLFKRNLKAILHFAVYCLIFILLTSIQWI